MALSCCCCETSFDVAFGDSNDTQRQARIRSLAARDLIMVSMDERILAKNPTEVEAQQQQDNSDPLLQTRLSQVSDSLSSTVSVSEDGSERSVDCGIFFGAVANLCSATLGAGVLALPFALYQAGLFFGGILMLSSAWATSTSIHILVLACDRYQLSTYERVVEHILGRKARQIVEISILIFCGGCAVAYLIAVGDILEQVESMTSNRRRLAMSIVWVVAMLPLSCLRRMQSLQCASTVGIASIFILLMAATAHLFHDASSSNDDPTLSVVSIFQLKPFIWPLNGSIISVIRACPIVFFAFSCQVNVCQIYDELPGPHHRDSGDDRKIRTMAWVTWAAVGVCGLVYASVSLVTLADFGSSVTPNILSCYNLTSHDSLLHVAFLAMALAVVMAYPLNIFPARVSVIQMLSSSKPRDMMCIGDDAECRQPLLSSKDANGFDMHTDMERTDPEFGAGGPCSPELVRSDSSVVDQLMAPPDEEDQVGMSPEVEFHMGQHMLVTVLVSGGTLLLALVIPNISVIFGLLGGTTSSLLGFVIPGLLGLQMDRKNITAWILVVAGSFVGLLTTGVTVYSTVLELL
jgi:amino acid permease